MPSELSPQEIREVRFREKLRGYHPEDVDAFIAGVASTVESLRRRVEELESAGAGQAGDEGGGAAEGAAGGADIDESLRRTLVLAQRTADLAVQEAREEAARLVDEAQSQRAAVLEEVESLRSRVMAELENELGAHRKRLHDERDALQRDVEALSSYVAQERERLRIYFSQQLDQVERGVPGIAPPPETEGPAAPTTVVADTPGLPEQQVEDASRDGELGSDALAAGSEAAGSSEHQAGADQAEDDAFLAELRRAVTDTEPLGPREHEAALPPKDDKDYEIFTGDDGGRFLRRRR